MLPRGALAVVRVAAAVVVLAAIGYQFGVLASAGRLDVVNYFSYFTILSNLLAATVFLIGALRFRKATSRSWDLVRGQAVVVMSVTFVVFAVLLAGTDVDVTNPWVDTVLHRIFPLIVIADWLVDPPVSAITLRDSLVWLVAPLAWTGYTVLRGAITGWYPYPFLDPANGGYGTVGLYVVGILIFGMIVCVAVAFVGSAMRPRRIVAPA